MFARFTLSIRRYPLPIFFTLAFGFTWANWLPQALANFGLAVPMPPGWVALLAGYGPALAAVIVTALTLGRAGLRSLGRRLLTWRVGLRWYAAALLIPAGTVLAGIVLLGLFTPPAALPAPWPLPFGLEGDPLWTRLLVLFAVFTLGFDGLGEELGWRGYALPKLQERRTALRSSLVLGMFWATWHIPYALSAGSAMEGTPFLFTLLDVLAKSVLMTWIFNHTRGSVLLAILFHATDNTLATLLPHVLPLAAHPLLPVLVLSQRVALAAFLAWRYGPETLTRPAARPQPAGEPAAG